MSPAFATILDTAGNELGGFLPRLAGALVLLVVGLLLAKLLGRIARRALHAAGVDSLTARWSVDEHLRRTGLGDSVSVVIGRVIRISLSLIVIFAALSLLGLQFLSESLNEAVLAIPKVIIAALLVFVGIVLGGIVRARVERLTFQMDLPVPLGRAAQIVVVAIFAITAAAQIAVSTAVLLIFVGIALAGVVGTLALAFGLGSRPIAGELSAGRYVQASYRAGQRVSLPEATGTITEMEPIATLIRTDDGRTLRVPNHMLLDRVVEVSPPEAGGEADPPAGRET